MENKTMPGQVNCAVELPRARTRRINVGGVAMGAGAPVVVQSMLTAPTANPEAAIAQAKGLAEAGCEIVRAAIPNSSALDGFAQLCRACPVPVVADIHFDHRLAVRACELGASGLRINPGNIGSWDKVDAVIDAARAAGIPIRFGVNAGSIDRELDALYVDYDTTRHSYERVTSQRAELLRDIRRHRADKSLLVPWNLQLVELGVRMIRRRMDLLAFLVPQARRVHAFLTGNKGSFNVTYQSTLGQVLHEDDAAMKTHFLDLLAEVEDEEIARGASLIGPHRDDLVFYENGIDLRTYGSQGQQRTAILSMKMAAIDAYEQHLSQKPLLLLDDVMSELDFDRQRAVMEIVIKKKIQTFITGTGLDFTFKNFGYDPVFRINEGHIVEQK